MVTAGKTLTAEELVSQFTLAETVTSKTVFFATPLARRATMELAPFAGSTAPQASRTQELIASSHLPMEEEQATLPRALATHTLRLDVRSGD